MVAADLFRLQNTASAYIGQQLQGNTLGGQTDRNSPSNSNTTANRKSNLAKQIQSKCTDGDIRSALRILSSEDTLLPPSKESTRLLQEKHPSAPDDFNTPTPSQ